MDKISLTLIADLVILLLILWKLFQGRSQGLVKKVGGLASLVLGLFGGKVVQRTCAEYVSVKWLQPGVSRLLEKAKDSLGTADLMENLGSILNDVKLPEFLKTNVVEHVAEKLSQSAQSALTAAAGVIADRLASWLLFLLGFVVIYLLASLVFNGILDPIIRKLPLIKGVNRLGGALLGCIQGILIAGIVLLAAYKLIPALSQEAGAMFSPASVEKSFLVKLYFQVLPDLFR